MFKSIRNRKARLEKKYILKKVQFWNKFIRTGETILRREKY